MTSAFAGAVLALIVFVITQSILKFVIEPIQEQKKLIGEIANAFVAYADVPIYSPQELYERPEETSAYRERLAETRQELRRLSGRLRASLWAIPFYKLLSRVKSGPQGSRYRRSFRRAYRMVKHLGRS
jgi:cobalamin biosynthesis protein CobD/CbiB